ncbi:hypothetical protein D3C78_1663250 [compost metagenome]
MSLNGFKENIDISLSNSPSPGTKITAGNGPDPLGSDKVPVVAHSPFPISTSCSI